MLSQDFQHLLSNLSERHKLIDLATTSCQKLLVELINKHDGSLIYINTLEQEKVLCHFNKHSFIFKRFDSVVSIIRTEIGIYYSDPNSLSRGMPIGTYTLDTTLDGEVIDDSMIEFSE